MFEKRRYVICRLAVAGTRRTATAASRSTSHQAFAREPCAQDEGRRRPARPTTRGMRPRRGPSPGLIVECIRHAGDAPHRQRPCSGGSARGSVAGRAAARHGARASRKSLVCGCLSVRRGRCATTRPRRNPSRPQSACVRSLRRRCPREAAGLAAGARRAPTQSTARTVLTVGTAQYRCIAFQVCLARPHRPALRFARGRHRRRVASVGRGGSNAAAPGHERRSRAPGDNEGMDREPAFGASLRGACGRHRTEGVRSDVQRGERTAVIEDGPARALSIRAAVAGGVRPGATRSSPNGCEARGCVTPARSRCGGRARCGRGSEEGGLRGRMGGAGAFGKHAGAGVCAKPAGATARGAETYATTKGCAGNRAGRAGCGWGRLARDNCCYREPICQIRRFRPVAGQPPGRGAAMLGGAATQFNPMVP